MRNRGDRRLLRLDLDPRVQAELAEIDNRMGDTERRLKALEAKIGVIRPPQPQEGNRP